MHAGEPGTASGVGRSRRVLGDSGAVLLAAAAWFGACRATPLPLWVGAAAVAAALAVRRPVGLVLATALLASALGARAQAGLVQLEPRGWEGSLTLVTDPVRVPGSTQAEARLEGRHVQLVARGAAGAELARAAAGDHLATAGSLGPIPRRSPAMRARHLVGRLVAARVARRPGTRPWWRMANATRRWVEGLGRSLPGDQRALFEGFVLGDDRNQSDVVAADFRSSGLTHLLVVSGENVAMLLVLAEPVLARLGLRSRWVLTLGLLAWFALLTRCEPSVLRAVAMAGIATTAAAVGRPASGVRVLSLAVAVLVLVDPLLVGSTGFVLSVAASAGILLGARPLADALPGPRPLAGVVAATAAAQLAVAPVLVARFGGTPVAGLPANVAAAPAAAAVMVWGLPALLLARLPLGPVAALARWPARLALTWVLAVARFGARLPLGQLGTAATATVAVGVAGLVVAARHRRKAVARLASALIGIGLLTPGLVLRVHPPHGELVGGLSVERSADATVVVASGSVRPGAALDALTRAGVRRIDVLVLRRGGAADAGLALALRHRWSVRVVLAPPDHQVRGAKVGRAGTAWTVGGLAVVVVRSGPDLLTVVVRGPPPPGAGQALTTPGPSAGEH